MTPVSETACFTAIVPHCGPQAGGAGGTTITVVGENFEPTAEYRARFALKSTAAMRTYTVGRMDPQWSLVDNSTQSEGDSTKFSAGAWMSRTEVLCSTASASMITFMWTVEVHCANIHQHLV